MIFKFQNTYIQLPERFYEKINPVPVSDPRLIIFNKELARELSMEFSHLTENELAQFFSGNVLLDGSEPIAQAYAGHQFGHLVPQLGDGRAVLLGEIVDKNNIHHDIQLKGSGPTRFSRQGDGRAALGPMLREYIISETMHSLGIPTTRTLCVVATGEVVHREVDLPGAIITRIAKSHIRVGTFEYFAIRNDIEGLRRLADYAIHRHYPQCSEDKNPYVSFFECVIEKQAELIAQWLNVGFIHGVMNTDNMAISGETIDYGPCAFMDQYSPKKVFSSIDRNGRYAFGNQPIIGHWNLNSLGVCLLPLFDNAPEKAQAILEEKIEKYQHLYNKFWFSGICKKLGIFKHQKEDLTLIQNFLELLEKRSVDFTLGFRRLHESIEKTQESYLKLFENPNEVEAWLISWRLRLKKENRINSEIIQDMQNTNPCYIARNHQVEKAIRAAEDHGDYSKFKKLVEVIKNPFVEKEDYKEYSIPPKASEVVHKTFCGT